MPEDFSILRYVDCFAEEVDTIAEDPVQLLLDEELRFRFVKTDFMLIRVIFLATIIPRSTQPASRQQQIDAACSADLSEYTCFDLVADGSVCGRKFSDLKGLQLHR